MKPDCKSGVCQSFDSLQIASLPVSLCKLPDCQSTSCTSVSHLQVCSLQRQFASLLLVFRAIHDEFKMKDLQDKDTIAGIQLLGVVLANSLPPFVPGCGIEKEK